MLEIIKSYFKNNKYYIILTEDGIFIKNYTKIIDINDVEILININNKIIKITGSNLLLKKSIGNDIEIKGNIDGVKKI